MVCGYAPVTTRLNFSLQSTFKMSETSSLARHSFLTLKKANELQHILSVLIPQWGAAEAEIKVPSVENTELKRSTFQAWRRSADRHTYYAYCQRVIPCLFLPFWSIHLHFFQTSSDFFLCWLWLTPVPVRRPAE